MILLCVTFSENYTFPPRSARLWPDVPPAAATIMGIIGVNAMVFLAWKVPPLWRTLNKYFISVPGYPFALATIGNVFSHQQFFHLAMNMAVLWVVGTRRTLSHHFLRSSIVIKGPSNRY